MGGGLACTDSPRQKGVNVKSSNPLPLMLNLPTPLTLKISHFGMLVYLGIFQIIRGGGLIFGEAD